MLNRKLGNCGSTLLMVIIITAVLSILGTVMLSMTLMNTTMKYNDLRSKKSMYLAESGIDQVYTILSIEIDKALLYAQETTQTNMQQLKEELDKTFDDEDETNDGIYPYLLDFNNDGHNDDFDGDGNKVNDIEFYIDYDGYEVADRIFNTKALQNVSNAYFRKNFAEYFDEKMNIGAIKSTVEGIRKPIIDTNITNAQINITFDENDISDFKDTSDGDNLYTIRNVTSRFQYGNLTDKEITTDIVIKLPDINPVSITNKIYSVEDNPIWQNTLVSEKEITFNNAKTKIDGNIYAYGIIPSSDIEKLDVSNYKGIELKNTLTEVDINGDMISKSDIKTIGQYSQLKVKGNVYCNSLMTYKSAVSSQINIEGKVYTYDDLELNANGSEINIKGKYYGFSIGNDDNIGHDNSSSILVNADISSGAKIKIGDNDLEPDVYIGGTSYINTKSSSYSSAEWPYQTGESFSIKGNYLYAYTSLPSDGSYGNTAFEETIHGFELAVGERTSLGNVEFYDVDDKIKYFYKQYLLDLVDGIPQNIIVGDTDIIDIDIDDYGYSLGNVIGSYNNKNIISEHIGASDDFQLIADNAKNDFYYYLYNFKPRENNETFIKPHTDNIVEDSIEFITGVNIFEINNNTSVLDSTENATEVIYVNDSSDEITITGEEGHSDLSNIKLIHDTSKMQGIIVTKGNVKIIGPLNFTGTIITTGNITIEGGEVYLSNTNENKDFLAKKIRANSALRKIFRNFGAQYGVYIIESERDTELFPDNEDDENYDLMNSTYHDLIYIDNWQVN